MITGAVKSDEARIRLKVKGRAGRQQEVDAVIDSGFTGALTLPPTLIATLGLRWRSVDRAPLADGSTCVFQVYVGKLAWEGKVRTILVLGCWVVDSLLGHSWHAAKQSATGDPPRE